jgi:hypothetical protein
MRKPCRRRARPPRRTSPPRRWPISWRDGPESTAQGAGKYAKGTSEDTIRALVAEALRNAQPTPDTNFRPALLYDYRFAHVIGRTIDGAPTNRIRVVVSRRDGAVITAYPR